MEEKIQTLESQNQFWQINHELEREQIHQLSAQNKMLEDVCLRIKRKNQGFSWKKTQDRDTVLDKMKNKMLAKKNETNGKQGVVEKQEETVSVISARCTQAFDLERKSWETLTVEHRVHLSQLEENILSLTATLEDQKQLLRQSNQSWHEKYYTLQQRGALIARGLEVRLKYWSSECRAVEEKCQEQIDTSERLELENQVLSQSNQSWQDKYDVLEEKSALAANGFEMRIKNLLSKCKAVEEKCQERIDRSERLELENQVLVQKQQNHESEIQELTNKIEILEEVCLHFKKNNLSCFGRKMQDRDTELDKMKNKIEVKQNLKKRKQMVVEKQEKETVSVIPARCTQACDLERKSWETLTVEHRVHLSQLEENILSLTETIEAQKQLLSQSNQSCHDKYDAVEEKSDLAADGFDTIIENFFSECKAIEEKHRERIDTRERLDLENQVLVQKQQNQESETQELTDESEILEEVCMQDRGTVWDKMKNKMKPTPVPRREPAAAPTDHGSRSQRRRITGVGSVIFLLGVLVSVAPQYVLQAGHPLCERLVAHVRLLLAALVGLRLVLLLLLLRLLALWRPLAVVLLRAVLGLGLGFWLVAAQAAVAVVLRVAVRVGGLQDAAAAAVGVQVRLVGLGRVRDEAVGARLGGRRDGGALAIVAHEAFVALLGLTRGAQRVALLLGGLLVTLTGERELRPGAGGTAAAMHGSRRLADRREGIVGVGLRSGFHAGSRLGVGVVALSLGHESAQHGVRVIRRRRSRGLALRSVGVVSRGLALRSVGVVSRGLALHSVGVVSRGLALHSVGVVSRGLALRSVGVVDSVGISVSVPEHGVRVVLHAGRSGTNGSGLLVFLVLIRLGGVGESGGGKGVAAFLVKRVAGSGPSCGGRVRGTRRLGGGNKSPYREGGAVGAQGVPERIAVGVLQVEPGGGFLHQFGFAVGVFARVAAEVGVGRRGSGGRRVAVGRPQVVLQALHVFGGADAQQLGLLLLERERYREEWLSEVIEA
ncbi:hypothetical protein EYF80_042686 [Liparis tanakae]|uniref:Uncharacterized protein n=1 Tax=Liparis tanakae TaxID=230148 RepID=A0A4Z2G1T5_9TELE|nr:hypothetical protein EYF80_042686 [Liparis tanakae]